MEQRPKTRTELQEYRKLQLRNIGTEFMEKHIKHHPHIMEIVKPNLINAPSYTTPYVHNPRVKTKAELDQLRRSQGLMINEQTVNFNCKTLAERVEEREKLRVLNKLESSQSERVKDQSKNNIKTYESKFAKRPVGVHGEELPKFSDHIQEFWKLRDGYVENPSTCTREENYSRPISVFTRLRAKTGSIDSEITKKPGEINPFPGFVPKESEGFSMRPSSRSRFIEEQFLSSRPSSVLAKEPSLPRTRPATAAVKPDSKSRPKTAATTKSNDKSVRSSGFL
jgi:hypothetical protein